MTSSTPEGALRKLQHPLASGDLGMCVVPSLEAAQLQPGKRLCSQVTVTTTFDVKGKSTPDHERFSFLPPLFALLRCVLLRLP